jgi:hypothetical protein
MKSPNRSKGLVALFHAAPDRLPRLPGPLGKNSGQIFKFHNSPVALINTLSE